MMMVTSLPTVVTALGHPTGVGGHGSLNGGGLKLSQVDGKVSTFSFSVSVGVRDLSRYQSQYVCFVP